MFIKVDQTNYYIEEAQNKTVEQIFAEIFSRMNKQFISEQEKRYIYSQIANQIHR